MIAQEKYFLHPRFPSTSEGNLFLAPIGVDRIESTIMAHTHWMSRRYSFDRPAGGNKKRAYTHKKIVRSYERSYNNSAVLESLLMNFHWPSGGRLMRSLALFLLLCSCLTFNSIAQDNGGVPGPESRQQPPRGFGGPIELGPDDKQIFEDPPKSIIDRNDGIEHGKLEMVEYESKTVGTTRKMNVYTPPGYSKDKQYPVLYLLHGIGGDETEWQRYATVDVLFDNLIAAGKATPMIVVMPNGRAQKNDRAEGNVMASAPALLLSKKIYSKM